MTNQATDISVSGNLDLLISLYDVPSGGSALWEECWVSVKVQQGRVALNLGAANTFQSSLGMSLGEFVSANPRLFAQLQVCDAATSCGNTDVQRPDNRLDWLYS